MQMGFVAELKRPLRSIGQRPGAGKPNNYTSQFVVDASGEPAELRQESSMLGHYIQPLVFENLDDHMLD